MKSRVRFAPSPSGYLHVGGARTALFNWLWAKKTDGAMILRVEDTDAERSTIESRNIIISSLKWLGITWDEGPDVGGSYGPYIQSERLSIYKFYADKLIDAGKAYRCYCTDEELKAQKASFKAKRDLGNKGAFFKYPGICRDRKDQPDLPYVVRFKAPLNGSIEYTDKIFGKIITPNKENQDFIILRSDGLPLYNFGCVVDDALMKITLVGRGSDHAVNAPIQIMLYEALGFPVPEFAHLPLMRSLETNEKLSKRHGSVSVSEYKDKGYSPDALLSYLSKFGWGHKDTELFSRLSLIELFDWNACNKSDGKFDFKKLEAINYQYIKSDALTSDKAYAHYTLSFLAQRGIQTNLDQVSKLVPIIRYKCKNFVEAANELDPMFRRDISLDDNAQKLITPEVKTKISDYKQFLANLNDWSEVSIRENTQTFLTRHGLVIKDIGQPIRACIYGRTQSPDLFKVMGALGKDATIHRLSAVL